MTTTAVPNDTSQPPMTEAEFEQASQFVIELAMVAYRYGVSTYRLQNYLAQLSPSTLGGLRGEVSVAPPFLNLSFWRPADVQQRTFMLRLPAVSFDLNKLAQIGQLMNHFEKGQVAVADGIASLKQIDALPSLNGMGKVALGYALCGASFAVLLSAAWFDMISAALLALLVYAVVLQVSVSPRLITGLELIAALVASVAANTIARFVPGSNPSIVAICAVVVLIPGLALTQGVGDLLARSIVSGASRLVDGVVTIVKLFVGVAIGSAIVTTVFVVPPPAAAPAMPVPIKLIAVLVLMAGLALVFQVRPQDRITVIVAGLVAYVGVLFGGLLGTWQGSFIGAVILGVYATLFAVWGHRPSSIVMLPGIMILVPGVAAYFGLSTLETNGLISGLAAFWEVLIQIVAIVAGLVTAVSIVPSKASL